MAEKLKRKRSDNIIGLQAVLNTQRKPKPINEGNLYELFPPLTKEEKKGWSKSNIEWLELLTTKLPVLEKELV